MEAALDLRQCKLKDVSQHVRAKQLTPFAGMTMPRRAALQSAVAQREVIRGIYADPDYWAAVNLVVKKKRAA